MIILKLKRHQIFFLLLHLFSCDDSPKNSNETKQIILKSDSIVLKFIDYTGKPMRNGEVGIHLKEAEELTSTILENPKRMLAVDSSGVLKLHRSTIAKLYRVNDRDSLAAFYILSPKTFETFVLDLNEDSVIIKVVYL